MQDLLSIETEGGFFTDFFIREERTLPLLRFSQKIILRQREERDVEVSSSLRYQLYACGSFLSVP